MIFFSDGGPPNWVQSERIVERGPLDISIVPHYSKLYKIVTESSEYGGKGGNSPPPQFLANQ